MLDKDLGIIEEEKKEAVPDLRKPKKGWINTVATKEDSAELVTTENDQVAEVISKPKKTAGNQKKVLSRKKNDNTHPKKRDENSINQNNFMRT